MVLVFLFHNLSFFEPVQAKSICWVTANKRQLSFKMKITFVLILTDVFNAFAFVHISFEPIQTKLISVVRGDKTQFENNMY